MVELARPLNLQQAQGFPTTELCAVTIWRFKPPGGGTNEAGRLVEARRKFVEQREPLYRLDGCPVDREGVQEAINAGRLLREQGYSFDECRKGDLPSELSAYGATSR